MSLRLTTVMLAVTAALVAFPAGAAAGTDPATDLDPATDMSPADGLRLAPTPEASLPAGRSGSRPVAPSSPAGRPLPFGPVPLAAMAAVAGAAQVGARRVRRGSGADEPAIETPPWQDHDVPAPPEDVLFIFVVGHGNDLSAFDDMKAHLGLDPTQYRDFDYRWIIQDADHSTATQHATNDQLADALQAFVAGLTTESRPVYLVGFSKGGAGLAKLVARWDRAPEHAPDSVIGAALLDPPISDGPVGSLQSLGLLVDPIPDDGFYDPEYCRDGVCHDERIDLGRQSGVEVIVVRNPDSSLTNFSDDPTGLRIYDLEWDGGTPDTDRLPFDPFGFVQRSGEAHSAVLASTAVAACISQETHRIKSCDWKGRFPALPRWVELQMWWRRAGGGVFRPKAR